MKRAAPPALVIRGVRPWTQADGEWHEQALKLRLTALPTLRASAERWAAGLTTLLGGAGLLAALFGPERFEQLASPYEALAKGLFFAAAVLAAVATGAALVASSVAARRVFLATGPAFQAMNRAAVRTTLKRLSLSRWSAAASVLLLLCAAAIVYFGPRDPSTSTPVPAIPARAHSYGS